MPEAQQSSKAELNSDQGATKRAQQEQYSLIHLLPAILNNEDFNKQAAYHRSFIWDEKPNIADGNLKLLKSFSKKGTISIFNKLPPSILSALVPSIRLFKVFFDPATKRPLFDWEIPFTDYVDGKDVEDILKYKRGTLNGANIVDFSYSYIGTNPAEAESCLTAKLNLKFQSIDKLLKPIFIDKSPPNQGKIIEETANAFSFRFSDLALQNARYDENFEFNKDYYRLKAIVSYKTDADTIKRINHQFSGISVDQVIEAIDSTVVLMHLYPTLHEISFDKSGVINFSIDYRGALETIFMENFSDVFFTSNAGKTFFDKFKATQKQIADKRKDLNQDPAYIDTIRNCIKTEDSGYKTAKENIDKEEKEAQEELDDQAASLYNSFFGDLIQGGSTFLLTNAKINNSVGAISGSSQELNDSILSANRRSATDKDYQELIRNTTIEKADKDYVNGIVAKIPTTGEGAKSLEFKSLLNAASNKIYFVTVGEIINQVYTKFIQNTEASTPELPALLLGNMPIIIPQQFGNIVGRGGSLSPIASESGIPLLEYSVPISKLPISINNFTRWFLEKVIKPKRTKYPLQVFLNDLIDLVRLSTLYVYGETYGNAVSSKTVGLGINVNKTFLESVKLNPTASSYEQYGPKDFNTILSSGNFSASNLSTIDSRDLYILFVNTMPVGNVNPTEIQKNESKGIITYTIGSQTGVLKDASFKKMNINFQKESKMVLDNSLNRGVLRMKYNCSLTLFGPSFYIPGDILIVNPVFLSSGAALPTATRATATDFNTAVQSLLIQELGLGGIYVVNKIDTKVSSGVCETTLDCIFLQYGKGVIETPSGRVELGPCSA